MQIRDVMQSQVVSIAPEESAALAARLLARYNIGALPVCTADGRLRGIVTDRDIILRCVAAEEDPAGMPVKAIMTRYPLTLSPEETLPRAAQCMASQQVRRLPVVEEGRVIGVVSLGDLARCGQYEMEISRALTDISSCVRRG